MQYYTNLKRQVRTYTIYRRPLAEQEQTKTSHNYIFVYAYIFAFRYLQKRMISRPPISVPRPYKTLVSGNRIPFPRRDFTERTGEKKKE